MATIVSVTDKYTQLIQVIRLDHEATLKNVKRFTNSSKTRIPDLCNYLKDRETDDGFKMSLKDIRETIFRDCSEFWERETIRKAFPTWLIADYADNEQLDQTPQGYTQYGNSGMMIPVEDKKYYSAELESCVLMIKRSFRQLIKEAENSNDVQEAFSDYCYANNALKNVKSYIENVGKQFKLQLVDPTTDEVKQLRKPISVYNLNFPVHDDLKPYYESITQKAELFIKQLNVLINGLYRYPILSMEDARYIDMCMTSLLIESYQAVNFKSSQTLDEMFETEQMTKDGLTEKQAGKNSKTKTLVCQKCLKHFNAEKNDDPPVMEIDRASPTGFRCPECMGIEQMERGLTKDIVIQRRPFLEKVAYHVEKYPAMGVFTRFGDSVKKVMTGTRKTLTSGMLKQSSFGSSNDNFKKIGRCY